MGAIAYITTPYCRFLSVNRLTLFDASVSFWLFAAILTALSVAAALWPFLRPTEEEIEAPDAGVRNVLIAQYEEIKKDRERGLLSEEEEQSARAEVGRRLLALDRQKTTGSNIEKNAKKPIFQTVMIAFIPIVGLGLYAVTGAPGLQDQPFAERQQRPIEEQDIETLIARAEQQVLQNPNDLRGWLLLAPIYQQRGELAKAEDAYRQVLNIGPTDELTSASAKSNLGQVLSQIADGVVTDEAVQLFRESQKENARDPSPYFFEALYLSQKDQREEAIAAWSSLIARFETSNPPWLEFARQSLQIMRERNGEVVSEGETPQPGPTREDVEAAQSLTPEEQREMIEGMVGRLADRLEENPDDLTGWSRLIQSYMVLDDKEKAGAALKQAQAAFEGNEVALENLASLATRFGL